MPSGPAEELIRDLKGVPGDTQLGDDAERQ